MNNIPSDEETLDQLAEAGDGQYTVLLLSPSATDLAERRRVARHLAYTIARIASDPLVRNIPEARRDESRQPQEDDGIARFALQDTIEELLADRQGFEATLTTGGFGHTTYTLQARQFFDEVSWHAEQRFKDRDLQWSETGMASTLLDAFFAMLHALYTHD